MISQEYYCPLCGVLWNQEVCDKCGHIAPTVLETPKKYRKESYKKDTYDFYKKDKRNRRKKNQRKKGECEDGEF